jgi:hypothetical protein
MSLKSEVIDNIREAACRRFGNESERPEMEVWADDDFADWVSSHENRVRNIICHTPEFKAAPFCGGGHH